MPVVAAHGAAMALGRLPLRFARLQNFSPKFSCRLRKGLKWSGIGKSSGD
jgi:hypothetical protein